MCIFIGIVKCVLIFNNVYILVLFSAIFVIGNKMDLESERRISIKEGVAYARKQNFTFFETSALTGYSKFLTAFLVVCLNF